MVLPFSSPKTSCSRIPPVTYDRGVPNIAGPTKIITTGQSLVACSEIGRLFGIVWVAIAITTLVAAAVAILFVVVRHHDRY
jgi:hypothetical protein